MTRHRRNMQLAGPWRKLHGAIWLIGLAFLFWKGWIFPGIFVLMAISALIEVILAQLAPQAFEEDKSIDVEGSIPPLSTAPEPEHRLELLPSLCALCVVHPFGGRSKMDRTPVS